jgi:uncharacterized membrane protein YhhN
MSVLAALCFFLAVVCFYGVYYMAQFYGGFWWSDPTIILIVVSGIGFLWTGLGLVISRSRPKW